MAEGAQRGFKGSAGGGGGGALNEAIPMPPRLR